MNRHREIPDSRLSYEYVDYIQTFWRIRNITGKVENPLTPDIIEQWGRHKCRTFLHWEREAFLRMDTAFRQAHAEVVDWHQKRPKKKADPDERRMSSGRGNPRL